MSAPARDRAQLVARMLQSTSSAARAQAVAAIERGFQAEERVTELEREAAEQAAENGARDPFADDVLERLARSNQDYQRAHGHYIVPLAYRLLEARGRVAELERDAGEQRVQLAHRLRQVETAAKVAERAAVLEGERRIDALEAELEQATRALVRERVTGYGWRRRAEEVEQLLEDARGRAERLEAVAEAARVGRHSFQMLRHHAGNERATLAWAKTVGAECAGIFGALDRLGLTA